MVQEWKILVVNTKAKQEIESMTDDIQAKFLHITNLMVKLGPTNIGMPHVKHLKNKLWEIRIKGRLNIVRSIYCLALHKRIIILHSFVKKTQKTPKEAMEKATRRMKEINLL